MKRLIIFGIFLWTTPLFAQSHLATVAAGMAPNTWALLNQDDGGPANYSFSQLLFMMNATDCDDPIISFSHDAVYDQTSDAIYFGGASHCLQRIIKYDVATDHWSIFSDNFHHYCQPTENFGHTIYQAIDTTRRQFYWGVLTDPSCFTRWDIASNSRVPVKVPSEAGFPSDEASADYFPGLGHDTIAYVEAQYLGEYHPDTDRTGDSWTIVAMLSDIGGRHAFTRYSKRCACIIIFGGGNAAFDPPTTMRGLYQYTSGTPVRKGDIPSDIVPYMQKSIAQVDPVSGMMIVVAAQSVDNTIANCCTGAVKIYKYDPLTDIWTSLDMTGIHAMPPPSTWWSGGLEPDYTVGVPIPKYGVIAFMSAVPGSSTSTSSNSKVYLYKAPLLSFAEKCAGQGVIGCYGFNSTANVRDFPITTPYPMYYYWNGDAACDAAGLGTKAPFQTMNRLNGEMNAYAEPNGGACQVPTIDTSNPHSGAGALRLNVPATSDEGQGGYFDTTFAGLDQAKSRIGPDNGGEIWYQYYYLTHNLMENDFSSVNPNNLMKLIIFCASPPGNDYCGSDNTLTQVQLIDLGYFNPTPSISRNGIFEGYNRAADYNFVPWQRNIGGTIYLQNAAGTRCPYDGTTPYQSYAFPPCVRTISDTWQEITQHVKIQSSGSSFSISGTTLTGPTGTFDPCCVYPPGYVGRVIYIVGGGGSNSGYFVINAVIDNQNVTLNEAPTGGTGKTVYISDSANTIMQTWINGQLVIDLTDQPEPWDHIGTNLPGWGQFRLNNQYTGRTNGVAVPGGAGYVMYDDFIVSTKPFTFGADVITTPPLCVPDHLVFSSQPSSAALGASLGTIGVSVMDSAGLPCSMDASTITLAKHAGTCTGMTLNGTVSGANPFSTTNVNLTGMIGACSLDATDGTLTSATSNTFNITAISAGGSGRGALRKR